MSAIYANGVSSTDTDKLRYLKWQLGLLANEFSLEAASWSHAAGSCTTTIEHGFLGRSQALSRAASDVERIASQNLALADLQYNLQSLVTRLTHESTSWDVKPNADSYSGQWEGLSRGLAQAAAGIHATLNKVGLA